MWESATQKKSNDLYKKRDPRMRLRIQRVNTEITFDGDQKPHQAVTIINDISESGMGIFYKNFIQTGEKITMSIFRPQAVTVHGIVRWCEDWNPTSRIITMAENGSPHKYRLGIEFTPASEEERNQIAALYQSLTEDRFFPFRSSQ